MQLGKSELTIFDKVEPQRVIERSNWVEYMPITAVSAHSPIEFKVISDQYIDLNESILYVRLKINKGSGYTVAPINYMLTSAFSDAEVSLGDTVIEVNNHLYNYKAFMTILLNYNADAKNSTLLTGGYYEDDADKMESDKNEGFIARSNLQSFEFMGPLWLDTFNQSRFIIPNVPLKLKLTPSNKKFCLFYVPIDGVSDKQEPSIEIDECKLFVRNVSINSTVRLAHETGLKTENAIYPYQRNEMKNFVVSKNLSSISIDNIFHQRVPKLVVFAMVENKAFNGDFTKNPYNFQHFNVNFIGLYKDGISLPRKELSPDFKNGKCAAEYTALMQSLNMFGRNNTNSISLGEYKKSGYNLFAFNLAPDLAFHSRQPLQIGNIRLDLRFDEPLKQPINVIVMGLFDDEFQITESRRVIQ